MSLDEIRIPKERISVLIGKEGNNKKVLEKKTNTKLKVDSEEGLVLIEGDALDVFNAKPVIRAIGRGFNPGIADKLLDEEYLLEVVNLKDFANTKNSMLRIKSRIIGRNGTCKKNIEILTNTDIVVYGKTVSIIGTIGNCVIAKQAVERLLQGSKHGNVYNWIEAKRRKDKINL